MVAEGSQADTVYRLAYMWKPEAGQQWDIYLMRRMAWIRAANAKRGR